MYSLYLGTIFEDTLKWDLNTEAMTRKGCQQLHLLQKLRSFNVDPTILELFYNSFIRSVLTFSFICWFIILMLSRDTHYKELQILVPKSPVIKLEVCLRSIINKCC